MDDNDEELTMDDQKEPTMDDNDEELTMDDQNVLMVYGRARRGF